MIKIRQLLLYISLTGLSFLEAKNPLKAIVIGASSGIGRGVAKQLDKNGYSVGLVARRMELLESLQNELSNPSYVSCIDVTHADARNQLLALIEKMGGLDLMVISISVYPEITDRTWENKKRYVDVDVCGFLAMADTACEFFKKQNSGHLVGISSTFGLRGNGRSPEYCAAKAWASYYLESQRNYMFQNNYSVFVTEVCPGYVATERYPFGSDPAAYWEISSQEAGEVIVAGIQSKEKIVYVPRKVWLVAVLLKSLPDTFYNKYLAWLN